MREKLARIRAHGSEALQGALGLRVGFTSRSGSGSKRHRGSGRPSRPSTGAPLSQGRWWGTWSSRATPSTRPPEGYVSWAIPVIFFTNLAAPYVNETLLVLIEVSHEGELSGTGSAEVSLVDWY